MISSRLKSQLLTAFHQFYELDLRWSYLAVAALILLGVLINLFLPHGWTVWPFVFIAAVMSMVHEAADRSGQGIPPLHVYALAIGFIALWVIASFIFSLLNPLVLLVGIIAIAYHCARGYVQQRQRNNLIASRRAQDLCIHCGHPRAPGHAFCENCGLEPDPSSARLRRVASIVTTRRDSARARAALKPPPSNVLASQKEQALLARHRAVRHRRH